MPPRSQSPFSPVTAHTLRASSRVSVARHLVPLTSLERTLVGEYLDENRLVGGDAIDIDASAAVQSQRARCQLDTDRRRHAGEDERPSAALLVRVALMRHAPNRS
jgi:hypothetical protein